MYGYKRINNKKEGVDFQKLINKRGHFYYSSSENMVHHKFCIIDNRIVITGSYNWTYYAENRNWENIVIFENAKTVKKYINEFEKIKQNHEKIFEISANIKQDNPINNNEYLEKDYISQAETEIKDGNDLMAAKIYTELINLNRKQFFKTLHPERKKIIEKYNQEQMEASPFEIGILYQNGYTMVIPVFEKLPLTAIREGSTVFDNQTAVKAIIQRNDFSMGTQTILEFSIEMLEPSPKGTPKIQFSMTLYKGGMLEVICREINGFNRSNKGIVNLNKWI